VATLAVSRSGIGDTSNLESDILSEFTEVPDQSSEENRVREELLKKTVARDDLTFEQVVQLITALETKVATVSPEIEIARIQADSAKETAKLGGSVWKKEGVITGAVAAIATILTGYFSGLFGYQTSLNESLSSLQTTVVTQQGETVRLLETQQGELERLSQTNSFELQQTELTQRLAVVNQLLVIDPSSLGTVDSSAEYEERAENERKARICLLAAFGVLQIPEYVLGVSPSDPTNYSAALNDFLNSKYECDKNTVPTSSWEAPSLSGSEAPRIDPATWVFSSNNLRTAFEFEVSSGLIQDSSGTVAYYHSPAGNVFGSLSDRRFIVLDFTASGNMDSTVSYLLQSGYQTRNASVHLVIGRYGEVVQMRSFDETAFHAGSSQWNELVGLNRYSIAIELVNWGQIRNGRTPFGLELSPVEIETLPDGSQWHRYTETQMSTLQGVLRSLVVAYPQIEGVLTDAQISPPGRQKFGPGPLIDVDALSAAAFGDR
jgi:N-acetyl-anhydromuramyl-L-alanine amidase AmpD